MRYIPEILEHKFRAKRIIATSQHVDEIMAHSDISKKEGNATNENAPKAQDLHSILKVISKSHVKSQNTEFV